jgi:hypothetical protein
MTIAANYRDGKASRMNLPKRSQIIIALVSLIFIISIVTSTHGQESIKITGSLSDPNAGPIPGARITLYSLDRILQTTSDSLGRFKFDAIPTSNYEFEVLSPGFQRFTRQVDVADLMYAQKKTLELTVRMEIGRAGSPYVIMAARDVAPKGSCGPSDSVTYASRKTGDSALAGIVINQYPKMAVAGATLKLFDAKGTQTAQQQTNERGEFQFNQTAPGHYYITLEYPGYNNTKSTQFWVAGENTTYVTMQAVQLGKFVLCQ